MTVTDQIKILHRKIKQNQVQYELSRKAAKTSALSSGNLDKYGYLTGEDLKIKPEPTEKVTFEASPLGMGFETLKKWCYKCCWKWKFYSFYLSDCINMSLDSKHNKMDDFMTLPDNFKERKTKKKQIQKLKD